MKDIIKDYPWFNNVIDQFNNRNYGHAYIFVGNEGLGKELFAEFFAKSLLCVESETFKPCDLCKSCKLFSSKTHPDFYKIFKEREKKSISINQIKSLQGPVYATAFLGGNKVFLINLGELMSLEASDSLLKMLEEPPPNTYFIITSNFAKNISLTIRSRCREIVIPQPNEEQLSEWISQSNLNVDEVSHVIQLTRGNLLKAQDFLENGLLSVRKQFIEEIGYFIKHGDNLIELSSAWTKDTSFLSLKLEWMGMILMDSLRFKMHNNLFRIQPDTNKITNFLGQKVGHENLFLLLQQTNKLWSIFKNESTLKADYHLRALLINWSRNLGISPRRKVSTTG